MLGKPESELAGPHVNLEEETSREGSSRYVQIRKDMNEEARQMLPSGATC
jgi:hypothetical protein